MTLHGILRSQIAFIACLATACNRAPNVRDGDAAAVAPGEATQEAPKDPRVAVADTSRIKGDAAAKVWLVMASDFQCPACKYWHDNASAEIVRDYVATGKVRFAYLNFPLSQHQNARPAAEAAMCAGAQGKFWEMHDRIFDTQLAWSVMPDPVAHFRQLSLGLGVDAAVWDACMAEDVMLPMIDGDYSRGNSGGVGETPTFFIGSQVVGGAVPAAQLRPLLDAAISQAGGAGK